jgi:hypothetical protein
MSNSARRVESRRRSATLEPPRRLDKQCLLIGVGITGPCINVLLDPSGSQASNLDA